VRARCDLRRRCRSVDAGAACTRSLASRSANTNSQHSQQLGVQTASHAATRAREALVYRDGYDSQCLISNLQAVFWTAYVDMLTAYMIAEVESGDR
jgi:hypothetical protein